MTRASHVIVVGAGIIGCAIAHELARRGVRVQVIDRRDVGLGATQAAAGMLVPYIEAHERSPLLGFGIRSLNMYDEFVARIVEDSGMAVQYVRSGTLEVAVDEASFAHIDDLAAACQASGVAVERLDAKAVRDAEPQLGQQTLGGLLVKAHGFVGAGELTAALERAAGAHGVTFRPSVAARRIVAEAGRVRVETTGETLTSDAAVLSAGSWSGQIEIAGAARLPIRPVRGQLVHLEWPAPALARIVWSPRCYLVPWMDGSVLAGATMEEIGFDERATVNGVRELLDATCALMPVAAQACFRAVRVGLRPATPDNLPAIGPSGVSPRVVYATGHFRNGILLAPLTAALVADLILDGKRDAALDALSPARFGEC